MIKMFILSAALLIPMFVFAQSAGDSFIRGVDISFTPQIEDLGGKYTLNGVQMDALDIFKENGVNYVRLRLWHTPANGYCGLAKTLAYASRVKAKGFKLLLDFHYSDSWADPGKQNKPAAWTGLSFAALKESLYTYTRNVVTALNNQNTLPDMIQVGNEVTGGMLWPDGKLSGTANPTLAWQQFGELLKEAIRGVRDVTPDSLTKVMIHIDRGGDNATSRWFYDNVLAQGVAFDVIGLSYYPWWHGSLSQVRNNLNDLSTRYHKKIIIVETAYPWTSQSLNDGMGNIGVDPTKLPPGYPVSGQGQKAFLFSLTKLIKETSDNKGSGYFYWEPAYISVPPIGSSWEHLTTFDFTGAALNSITAFKNIDSLKTVNITIRVNTATHADTLKPTGIVQIRGEVKGIGSNFLPDGSLVSWDGYSQLFPVNTGGDYWTYTVKMYPSDRLEFKLWTGHTISIPTFLRLGWEGPITPFDGSNINGRVIVAGASDTTLGLEYYNPTGLFVDQYSSPVATKPDSTGVFFKVNVADLMKSGLFDPTTQGPLGVRGDSVNSAGVLSWSTTRSLLKRDTLSVANGSFWSGAVYFPKNTIAVGTQIKFKFVIENSSFSGLESNIVERSFDFPSHDTTLAWRFFNDRIVPTGIEERTPPLPNECRLFPNFPNPFNPGTILKFSIPGRSQVSLFIYNILGQKVRTLINAPEDPGTYSVHWNGTDDAGTPVVSGVYLVRLEAAGSSQIRKILLLK